MPQILANKTGRALMLENIHIVLVETSHAGNIGATARAMKNMGLSRLILVNPVEYLNAHTIARASGASEILTQAKRVNSLAQALEGMGLVYGASARLRKARWPQAHAKEFAQDFLAHASVQPVALVFGREDSGLTNEELDQCHKLVHIPSNPAFSSLNLSQAVQVLSYEIFQASHSLTSLERQAASEVELASHDELEGFYAHFYETLKDVGFLVHNSGHDKLMRRVRRLYQKAQLERDELHLLRGILRHMQQANGPK
jgi:tRNA/rRNA methyltransferase/tRNA (cytidine32/uridine32-2'-O)-methyltransferase